MGLSYLNMTSSVEKLNGTTTDIIEDQISVFTYKSFLTKNSPDNLSFSASNVSSFVSNVSSVENLLNNSFETENETIKLNNTVTLTEANENGMDFSTSPSSRDTTAILEKREEILPTANFSINVTEGYAPLTVQFSDLSENVTKRHWDFGDGYTSSEQNPVHIYSTSGTYNVNQIAINENDTSSKVAKITVYEQTAEVPPNANFSINITEGYAPLTVQFTDLSENSIGINWEFGDGNTANEQNPVHIYSTSGTYNVNLIAINENGTSTKVAIITVHEQPAGVLPVANFSSNITEGYAPLSIQFTDLSENATEWDWDFGDGDTSSEKNPVHTYPLTGNYTVNLEVTNENSTNSKFTKINVLQDILPVANFSSNVTEGYAPLTVQFIDISENATEINWDFDDGNTSNEQDPVHIYSKAGAYDVNLIATNENGTSSKLAKINVLQPILPVANFSSNTTEGYAPLTVQFTDLSENATRWRWDFEDEDTSSEQSPIHTYLLAGNYTVNLEVTNENGTNSKFAKINVLQPVLPTANFSSNVTEGYAPLTVQFTDFSENVTEWSWDFGDGNTSSEQGPVHIYSESGVFNVNLTATNENGTNIKTSKITVDENFIVPLV